LLIDFGLAHHARLPDLMQEEFRLPYGTAPYMAPEQIMGVRRDPRSDLFALGVLMYFFATGVRPFGDPKGLRGLKRRLWRDPVPPRKLRPDLPPWLQELILRCLEVNPAWAPSDRSTTRARPAPARTGEADSAGRAPGTRPPWDRCAAAVSRRRRSPLRPRSIRRQDRRGSIVAVAIDLAPERGWWPRRCAPRSRASSSAQRARGSPASTCRSSRGSRSTRRSTPRGHNKHVQRLVDLRHWAEPLSARRRHGYVPRAEATDPADAIHDYARANQRRPHRGGRARQLDHAPAARQRRRQGRSRGPCTVTVVRTRARETAQPS
jgi:serine/threonine protein kinase